MPSKGSSFSWQKLSATTSYCGCVGHLTHQEHKSSSQLVRACSAPASLRLWHGARGLSKKGRKEAGLWLGEIRVELRQKRHYSARPLPRIIEQNNYKQQSQILLCLSSEENPLSNVWDSIPLYVQANTRFGWCALAFFPQTTEAGT